MEQSSRTLERIGEMGIIVEVCGESRAAGVEVAAALIEGGVEAIEVSLTTPKHTGLWSIFTPSTEIAYFLGREL